MPRWALVALASIAGPVALGADAQQPPPTCEQRVQTALHSVVEWDRSQLTALLATVDKGRQIQLQLCGKLGMPAADPSKPSPVAALARAMDSVRGCADECEAGGPCVDHYRQLKSVATMACVGVRMLECDGGLTPELQSSCELLDEPRRRVLLGAARGTGAPAGAPAPAPVPNTSAQFFLAALICIPMLAVIASRFTRPRGPSERVYRMVAEASAHAPAAAAARSSSIMGMI